MIDKKYEEYLAKKRIRQRKYDALNREAKIVRMRTWRENNPEYVRDYYRRYDGLPEPTRPQPQCCECCGSKPSGRYRNLCLDHCHVTGTFRAWLCHRCNSAIGMIRDDTEILRKLIKILEKHRKVINK